MVAAAGGGPELRPFAYGKVAAALSAAAVFVLAVVLSVAALWSTGDGRSAQEEAAGSTPGHGLDLSATLGTPVRRLASTEGLAVKVFVERAVEALNVQRAECGDGMAPFVYQPAEIFAAWEGAEPPLAGEIVAAAARLGTSRVYGLSENRDGASKPLSFSLFELGDDATESGVAATIDVCTVAVSMGGRTRLNDKSGATDAMIYYVGQLNAICGFEPAIASARIRSARVRVVAGSIWSLDLRVAGQNIDDAEVLQDLSQSFNLTRTSRLEVESRWCTAIRESRAAFANASRTAEDDRPKSHSERQRTTKPGDSTDVLELSPAELEQLGGGLFAELQPVGKFGELEIPEDATEGTSTSYDLRTEFPECVNPARVQYQGQCGSCWSFAVHTAWANQVCIRGDAVTPGWTLSKQYQLTCNSRPEFTDPTSTGSSTGLDPNAPQSACEGGTLSEAWKWSMIKGAVSEEEIPYAQSLNTKNVDDTECARVQPTEKTKCRTRRRLRTDRQIMYAIEKFKTPVTVGMMTYSSFYERDWWGAVYQPSKAEVEAGERGGHAVQIVGWGVDNGGVSSDGLENPPYWIIENSWGNDWGETVSNAPTSRGARSGGYFRHIRGDLVHNTGDDCQGAGATDPGCVALSSFTDGGIDEASKQPKGTVFQNTFLIDGYFAEACENEPGTGRRCASAGSCREVRVLGGDAGTLISDQTNADMCVQEFQFRTSSQVEGLLVAEAPVDIDPAGGFDFGSPGAIFEFRLEQRARVHNFEITVPTAPGQYSLSFYPMDGDVAIGDPFTFDYPINCNNLQRPLVAESNLIMLFVAGAVAAAVIIILLLCHHFRSAAHKARQTGKVETYERKMVTQKDREARRKAREKERQKKKKLRAKQQAKKQRKK